MPKIGPTAAAAVAVSAAAGVLGTVMLTGEVAASASPTRATAVTSHVANLPVLTPETWMFATTTAPRTPRTRVFVSAMSAAQPTTWMFHQV